MDFVSWDDEIPNIWKNKIPWFQTTNQLVSPVNINIARILEVHPEKTIAISGCLLLHNIVTALVQCSFQYVQSQQMINTDQPISTPSLL